MAVATCEYAHEEFDTCRTQVQVQWVRSRRTTMQGKKKFQRIPKRNRRQLQVMKLSSAKANVDTFSAGCQLKMVVGRAWFNSATRLMQRICTFNERVKSWWSLCTGMQWRKEFQSKTECDDDAIVNNDEMVWQPLGRCFQIGEDFSESTSTLHIAKFWRHYCNLVDFEASMHTNDGRPRFKSISVWSSRHTAAHSIATD